MRRMAFALIACLGVSLAACKDSKKPPVVAGPSVADSADQILFKTRFLLSTHGIQRGDLLADTAYLLNDGTKLDLRKTHVTFTSETGAPEGTMEANRGLYNTQSQILEGWGNVVIKMVDGKTLKSPHVTFNQLTHTVASETTYTISRPDGTTSGIGFTSKISGQSFSAFQCLRSCSGTGAVQLPAK
jgi:LPS export ABC transporter protein LptC